MTDTTQNRKYVIKALPKHGTKGFTREQLHWIGQSVLDKVNRYNGNISYHTMPAKDYYSKVIGDGEHTEVDVFFGVWDSRNNWELKVPDSNCVLFVKPTAWCVMQLLNTLTIRVTVEKETL